MKKAVLLPLVCDLLNAPLTAQGYRFLKSQERYLKSVEGVRVWFEPNVTYWPSSDCCMLSPRMSAHVDAVEDLIAKHETRNADRHSPTFTVPSDNLEGAKFWSISSVVEFESFADEIVDVVSNVCLPILNNWSDRERLATSVIANHPNMFHSELHRLTVLFAYLGDYESDEMQSQMLKSIDLESIARSRCQLDPTYRQLLKSMIPDIPLIAEAGIDLQ